ncbi:hypothetical protein MAP00_008854 [Monascus purpureus]|nr:hypothetical protein MAP00_008854 [Monascus purpureus]
MAGKTSLSHLLSPADVSDELQSRSRRHSPRISHRGSPDSELNSANTSRSPYSFPSTPLITSFEDTFPTDKRRKTLSNTPKSLPAKDSETPPQLLHPTRNPDGETVEMNGSYGSMSSTNGALAGNKSITTTPYDAGTEADSLSKSAARTADFQQSYLALNYPVVPGPQDGQTRALLPKGSPRSTISKSGHRARRSLSAKVRDFTRRLGRHNRNTVGVNQDAEIPRASSQPAPNLTSSLDNGRPRSAHSAGMHSPITKTQTGDIASTPIMDGKSPEISQHPKGDHVIDNNAQESNAEVSDDLSSFDFDGDLHHDCFGLDGQVDLPPSAASASTAMSTGLRTSGRTRKPTIRALESIESQQRLRRAKTAAKKVEPSDVREPKDKVTPSQGEHAIPPAPEFEQNKLDLQQISKQLFDAAVAVLSSNLDDPLDVDSVLDELRKEYDEAQKQAADVSVSNGTRLGGSKPGESHTNTFGEEVVVVPKNFEWYRPKNTYGDDQLPIPPIRVKSEEQVKKDRIFGYPPPVGERNIPRGSQALFVVEDVEIEKAKVRAREEARKRDIVVHSSMSLDELRGLIREHDRKSSSNTRSSTPEQAAPVPSDSESGRLRKRRRDKVPSSEPQPRRRRQIHITRNATDNTFTAASSPAASPATPKGNSRESPIPMPAGLRKNGKNSPTKGKKRTLTDSETQEEQKPLKKLKLIITRPGMRREVTSTTNASDLNSQTLTVTTTAVHNITPDAQLASSAEPNGTTQFTIHNGENTSGRPRRRAAAAASAANTQTSGRNRRTNNTHKRKATETTQTQNHIEGEGDGGSGSQIPE